MLRTLLAALTLTLVAAPAWAQMGPGGRGAGKGNQPPGGALLNGPMKRLTQKLNLTAEQRTKLEKVQKDYRASIDADWTGVQQVKGKMRALWSSGEVPKKADLLTLRAQMMTHRMSISEKMFDAKILAVTILEPSQRKLLGKMDGKGAGGQGKKARRGRNAR